MVEPDNDLVISSEESQTAFEGEQTLLQPPPVLPDRSQEKKKVKLLGIFLLLVMIIIGLSWFNSLGPKGEADQPQISAPPPSPTVIVTDQAKEEELRRVEAIVSGADPDKLILPPPQVDMLVQF